MVREEESGEEAEVVAVDFAALRISLQVGSMTRGDYRGLRLPGQFGDEVVKVLERAHDGRLISEGFAESGADFGRRGGIRCGGDRGGRLSLFGVGFPVGLGLFVFARGNEARCCWRQGDSRRIVFEPAAVGGEGGVGKCSFGPL